MKSLILTNLIILFLSTSSFSQTGQIVYDSFYSPSLSRTVPLAIYLPPNHTSIGNPYRTYIFLHGAAGNTYTANTATISTHLIV